MAIALVTGASAGLGEEFVWQLAAARHDVVAVARDEERLRTLAAQVESAAGTRVEVLPADLGDPAGLARVQARVADRRRPIGLLVNNAGFGPHQPIVGGQLDEQIDAINVMIRAVLVLSHAAVNQMVPRGRGAVLNVASVAALTTGGTYSAAKAWVRTFTEGLAVELKNTGVTATALCPGLTHTEFHQRAGMNTKGWPEFAWLDAHHVVETALADVRRGAVISTPSVRYRAASAFLRLVPRGVVRAVSR